MSQLEINLVISLSVMVFLNCQMIALIVCYSLNYSSREEDYERRVAAIKASQSERDNKV